MALTRKFNGKVYTYAGSDRRLYVLRKEANRLRQHGVKARVVQTGKGKETLYTLYVRKRVM